jgi:mRNA-degrading endonuclease toxin of MazEF toxin-antitoxin module
MNKYIKQYDKWNDIKKVIENKTNINFKKDGSIKFRIRPWSIWWFEVGENIGTETSCHHYNNKISTQRPCVVISTNKFINETYYKKVVILPLTSKKENSKVKHFHYELNSNKYKSIKQDNIFYKGLEKDSLVICNDIKTIDTKRLVEPIYKQLNEMDKENIKKFIKRYISF